jgi:hypothetical protein
VMSPVGGLLRLADVGEDVSPFAQPETDNMLAIVKTSVILVSFEVNRCFSPCRRLFKTSALAFAERIELICLYRCSQCRSLLKRY